MSPMLKISNTILFAAVAAIAVSCASEKYKYDASGTFESEEIIVSAESNGKITFLNINEGDRLKTDTIYGMIDTVQLALKEQQLQASMKALKGRIQDIGRQLDPLKEQLSKQTQERDRIARLLEGNAANRKQLDDITSAIAVLRKQIIAQQTAISNANTSISGEIEALKTQMLQIEDMIEKAKIKSPVDGTVLSKYSHKGELAAAGKPLFKVADTDNMFLHAYITSAQLTQIKIGQEVKVYCDFGEKEQREYKGVITWISDKAEFTPKTIQTKDERANLVYGIKIMIENDGYAKIGMYGDVKF